MKSITLVTCVLIGALNLAACSRKSPQAGPLTPEVLVIDAATRDVPVYREWVGTIDGSENADIRARVKGHLIKRNYNEGSLVKKGDLLFEIDPRPFEAALSQAKSELEEGKAAALAAAADRARADKLFGEKVISAQEHTNKTQLHEANEAKVQTLEAAVEKAQWDLNFCKVTAPVDGIVGIAKAQVGDLVGNDVLPTSISTLDPARILFPVSEADYFAANEQVQEILNKPLEQRPEEIELILADGSTFRNKARLLAVDRQAVLLLSAERLMDGWGWTPISNRSRSDGLDRRIYREGQARRIRLTYYRVTQTASALATAAQSRAQERGWQIPTIHPWNPSPPRSRLF